MTINRLSVRHILLIDNDEDEFEILRTAVAEIDAGITVHYKGRFLEEEPMPDPLPHLILLDINMPGFDGFDWLSRIRNEGDVPVIMYSTSRNQGQIDRAFEMGANLFITKPNRSAELVHLLRELFLLDWAEPKETTRLLHSQGAYHFS